MKRKLTFNELLVIHTTLSILLISMLAAGIITVVRGLHP
jgi:hypothetical protein